MDATLIPHPSGRFGYRFPHDLSLDELRRMFSVDASLKKHPGLNHLTVLPKPEPLPQPAPGRPAEPVQKTVRRYGKRRPKR